MSLATPTGLIYPGRQERGPRPPGLACAVTGQGPSGPGAFRTCPLFSSLISSGCWGLTPRHCWDLHTARDTSSENGAGATLRQACGRCQSLSGSPPILSAPTFRQLHAPPPLSRTGTFWRWTGSAVHPDRPPPTATPVVSPVRRCGRVGLEQVQKLNLIKSFPSHLLRRRALGLSWEVLSGWD